MQDHMKEFIRMLRTATEQIEQNYFHMPVAGKNDTIYRERVYCYELYHQLRSLWDDFPFKLCGEVDKKSHPLIWKEPKPDMIVHKPKTMPMQNLAAIEVKTCDNYMNDYKADLDKLIRLCKDANYFRGILLVFGTPKRGQDDLDEKVLKAAKSCNQDDMKSIDVFYHGKPGHSADKREL